jgi:GTP-binding protein
VKTKGASLLKQFKFNKAVFIKSALTPESWPTLKSPSGKPMQEIAIVGKSNVGKSSLLNHLFQNNKLARVSSTPGKTNTLNFFTLDDQIALVDLPGYGYAKVSKEVKENWSHYLDLYLNQRSALSLLLLLIDIRRTMTEEDIAFIEWGLHHQKPLLIIFTKCDKVSSEEKIKNSAMNLSLIPFSIEHCFYSIKDSKSRIHLIEHINRLI